MRIFKRILLLLVVVFIVIQFIRPAPNTSDQALSTDISGIVTMPDKVQVILKNSCYDCHSDNTRYPWYVNIQPIGWILANHIKNGKADLNFSEFGTYSKRKQANKLRSVATSITDGSMPLSSYIVMHRGAKINPEDQKIIAAWALQARDSLLKN